MIEELFERALKGDSLACVEMGNKYYTGTHECDMDTNKAVFWWEKAAEMDNAEAQYNLGIFYYNADVEKARYWLKRVSQQDRHNYNNKTKENDNG